MGTTLTIFTKSIYKEHVLSAVRNQEERVVLDKDVFGLKENYILRLENKDNEWFFVNDRYEIMSEGAYYSQEPLKDGTSYIITTEKGGERIVVTVSIKTDFFEVYTKYRLDGVTTISIGSSGENDFQVSTIYEGRNLVSGRHAMLYRKDNLWVIEEFGANGVFVNERRVTSSRFLNFGDIIAIWGLKILYLENCIAVNNYENFRINTNRLFEVTPESLFSTDAYGNPVDTYPGEEDEKKYFHRSPRSIDKLSCEPIEIEPPPQPREENETPLFMLIGPSFTMMLPMLLGSGLAIIASRNSGAMGGSFMFTGIITAASSGLLGAFWAINNIRYAKKKTKQEETRRFEAYSAYLLNIANEIKEKYIKNTEILKYRYPEPQQLVLWDAAPTILWERNPRHEDFLYHRIGIGDMPFQAPISVPREKFSLINDSLSEKPKFIKDSYSVLKNVPIGVNLLKESLVGIVGGRKKLGAYQVIRSLVAQIAVFNAYTEVKIALVSDVDKKEGVGSWEYITWLPHVWSQDKKFRFVSFTKEEASDVCYELAQIIRQRKDDGTNREGKKYLPHYIVIVEDNSLLEEELVAKYLYEAKNIGFTTLIMAERASDLPNQCEYIIENDKDYRGLIDLRLGKDEGIPLTIDDVDPRMLSRMSHKLANIELNETDTGGEIPSSLTFFEMYGVSSLEGLNVKDRWRKNKTYESMKALIGVRSGGQECYLDLHEKYHGPHGLVAGTTGSGKSETLQTYLLSLVINFSPDDVGLFIIDFKGGGMGNLFSDLPHVVGQISNLSGNQVRRAMVSIKSENMRRQVIFNQNGVNNINAYTRLYKNGEAKMPIPHLLIVIDEFAELKREEPEFMQELISVAQVGRSLGVHLILATQKPSGTVDDNIFSNTKFRLCLRVQDKQDSMDMLHKPDAAYLTQAGRGYLQVGNDELYEQFQSGWSGAVYDADDETSSQDIARIITDTGRTAIVGNLIRNLKKENSKKRWVYELTEIFSEVLSESGDQKEFTARIFSKVAQKGLDFPYTDYNAGLIRNFYLLYMDAGKENDTVDKKSRYIQNEAMKRGIKLPEAKEKTQLDAIVEYLIKVYEEGNYIKQQPLWLPVLKEKILVSAIDREVDKVEAEGWHDYENRWELTASVALLDDPENQYQMPLVLNFTQEGNHAVCGIGMSGKSTLLQTIIYSMIRRYSPKYLNIYILDFSNRMLEPFESAPQIGGILYENDVDSVGKFFKMLQRMIKSRKALFRGGNYSQYVAKNGMECPAVVVVIDNIANLREKTEEKFDDTLVQISRECAANGIYLLISAAGFGISEITGKLAENIKRSISLEMPDKYGYSDIIKTMNIQMVPDSGIPGRGLAKVEEKALEFQACVALDGENDYERIEAIREKCDRMRDMWHGPAARPIPRIPEKPAWSEFSGLESVSEAIAAKEILPFGYNTDTADIVGMNLKRSYCFMVTGKARSGKTNALKIMMRCAHLLQAEIITIEFGNEELSSEALSVGSEYIQSSERFLELLKEKIIPMFVERTKKRKELLISGMDEEELREGMKCFKPVFIFIADLVTFAKAMHEGLGAENNMHGAMTNFIEKGGFVNVYFIGQLNLDRRVEALGKSVYDSFAKYKTGIHLGGNADSQNVLEFADIPFRQLQNSEKAGTGYVTANEDDPAMKVVIPFAGK